MRPYLQIVVCLVRHLKELVSLPLKKKMDQTVDQCCFHFFYIKKVNLKSHTWKLSEHYLKINMD